LSEYLEKHHKLVSDFTTEKHVAFPLQVTSLEELCSPLILQ